MATIDAQVLREMIKQFRVLIMGRANAGKTSILHKVCNTTDEPEIYDTKGHKIDTALVEASIKRGNHDIRNEMVFKSNPTFVFHDSCGFEAGSEAEFEDMKSFISERAQATKLEERLHAIWFCIPMDDHCRTFQRAEEKFFSECDTGHIPVIVIFTKFDALRPIAFGELKKELKGAPVGECLKGIPQRVEELFMKTGVLDRLYDSKNRARPKSHVRCENMQKPNTNCNILLEHTTLALDNEELQLCLISTQQSNLELCIKCAVTSLVNDAHQQSGPVDYDVHLYNMAKWFPHLKLRYYDDEWWKGYYDDEWWKGERVPDFNNNLFNHAKAKTSDIIHVLQPLVANRSLFTAATNRIIHTGIATIIVLEYSAFLPNNAYDKLEDVKSAVDYYLTSPTAAAVEKGAKDISRSGFEKEELERKILDFILENRMSKNLAAQK